MVKLYSNALAVFFAPIDEDYGFITLEAMQSGNLVITCNDSGGPLEFITDGRNGFVLEPNPEVIAEKIDRNELESADKIISQMKRDKDWTYPEAIYDRLIIALKKGDSKGVKDALETLKGDYPNLPITVLARRIAE